MLFYTYTFSVSTWSSLLPNLFGSVSYPEGRIVNVWTNKKEYEGRRVLEDGGLIDTFREGFKSWLKLTWRGYVAKTGVDSTRKEINRRLPIKVVNY